MYLCGLFVCCSSVAKACCVEMMCMLIKIDNDECIPQSSEPVASRLGKNYKCLYAYVGGL